MEQGVIFAQALADPVRWRILHLIYDRPLCVCELTDVLGLPQSTLSSQLKVIQRAQLLQCERQGKWLFYSVRHEQKPLLRRLFRHFEADGHAEVLKRDKLTGKARIAQRKAACCPPSAGGLNEKKTHSLP